MSLKVEPTTWEYMIMPLTKYSDFSGRSRRKEYWLWTLMLGVSYFLFGFIAVVLGDVFSSGRNEIVFSVLIGVVGLLGLAILIPGLAVTVRRLHDTNRSGWWVLIQLVPYIGGIVMLVFTCMDSHPGPNKWGPNPKDPDEMELEDHLILDS